MKKSAREFNCARCHRQVIICSSCDRGNIYCGPSCSRQARVINHRIANQIYQKTLKGRRKHADRQRRYRQRQKEKTQKVTDQGSNDLSQNDLLSDEPIEGKSRQTEQLYCHFCRRAVSTLLRNGFLRHHRENKLRYPSSWPLGP
jgi:hypothetical protein